jgi:hypothetical protein
MYTRFRETLHKPPIFDNDIGFACYNFTKLLNKLIHCKGYFKISECKESI